MKVLHITVNYPTKAHPIFGIFVKEQVDSLRQIGVDCDVYFSNGKECTKEAHKQSISKIKSVISAGNYDIIHCHHSISALILLLSGRAFNHKCLVSYQNDPEKEFGGKWLFYLLYPFFNKIIVKNPSKYLCKKKVVYLPNGTNSDFFRPMDKKACRAKLDLSDDKKYILYMDSNKGTRTQKRHDRFCETIELLRKKYIELEVIELSNTPREMIPTYMNACDLHLLTSDFEGSPNSVKECLCCNTPVVSTDVGNVRDMIGDLPGCYVSDSFTAKELAEKVDLVLSSSKNFNVRDLFLAKGFGIEAVAGKLLSLYKEIINK